MKHVSPDVFQVPVLFNMRKTLIHLFHVFIHRFDTFSFVSGFVPGHVNGRNFGQGGSFQNVVWSCILRTLLTFALQAVAVWNNLECTSILCIMILIMFTWIYEAHSEYGVDISHEITSLDQLYNQRKRRFKVTDSSVWIPLLILKNRWQWLHWCGTTLLIWI